MHSDTAAKGTGTLSWDFVQINPVTVSAYADIFQCDTSLRNPTCYIDCNIERADASGIE